MRFQVPQFTDIADKVVGPFTLKQFLIYLFTGLFLIPIYLSVGLSAFVTIALPILGIGALFAHFRLHGKSLFQVLINAGTFVARGPLFIWRRTGMEKPLEVQLEVYAPVSDAEEQSRLAALARELATEGNIVKADIEDPLDAGASNQ